MGIFPLPAVPGPPTLPSHSCAHFTTQAPFLNPWVGPPACLQKPRCAHHPTCGGGVFLELQQLQLQQLHPDACPCQQPAVAASRLAMRPPPQLVSPRLVPSASLPPQAGVRRVCAIPASRTPAPARCPSLSHPADRHLLACSASVQAQQPPYPPTPAGTHTPPSCL